MSQVLKGYQTVGKKKHSRRLQREEHRVPLVCGVDEEKAQ